MGTRSLTVFVDGESEIAVLYRQFDGYPSGMGKDLASYLAGKYVVNGIGANDRERSFNGMADATVRCIVAMKMDDREGWDYPGNYYLHPAKTRDCGEEFVYYVGGQEGKEITFKAFRVSGGYGGTERQEELIFDGSPSDFLVWVESPDGKEA